MTVTAIMPTRGRNVMAAMALDSFLRQTYPLKQLIILDDWAEPSFDYPPPFADVCYLRHDSRSIAEKRNVCCSVAAGLAICHWDSDDFSGPDRIAEQVRRLEASTGSVVGYHSLLFYDIASGRAAKYVGDRGYALGTSLMYRREFWKAHPFQDNPATPNVGEDNQFTKTARELQQLDSCDAESMMVARVHPGNTSVKDMNKFNSVPIESIPRGFFA